MNYSSTLWGRRPAFLFLLLFVLAAGRLSAQTNINGIINSYAKVLGFNTANDKLRFGTPYGTFAVGNKVLVMQMKGATYNTPNTSGFGQLTALNNAGQFEYASIAAITGDTITLTSGLCHLYSAPDSVQIIRVPVYTGNVNVTGALTAYDWNLTGGYGGVLAFEATGTVTLNANIDVSGKGFRGGVVTTGNSFVCAGSGGSFYVSTNADGRRGEGIGLTYYIGATAQPNGRGRLVNGGGAAGAGNTGAGGGGNFGAGGNGGNEWTGCGTSPPAISIGGNGLSYTAQDRVFLGGGGGGPQADNGYTVYAGGNGGGIVMIKAAGIVGNGNNIRANGAGISQIINDEGGSGGGAGGAVYLQCPTYSNLLNIEARGGNGTSNNNTLFPATCHGPGAGGGGGIVWFSTAATPAGVTTSVIPGPAGTVNNPSSPCFNTTSGAQPGQPGGVQYNLSDISYTFQNLKDTVICAGAQVTLNIGSGFSNILWSTGATTPSIVVSSTGTYYVQATTSIGCVIRDTAIVTLDAMTLGNDTVICKNTSVVLSPKPAGNFTSYLWQDGSTASTYTASQTGNYSVQVVSIYGCTLRDTIRVVVDTPLSLRDTFLCSRTEVITLDLGPGYASALWNTGATTTSIQVSSPGVYNVVGTRINGCVVTEDAIVTLDTLSIGPDTLVCGAINYQLIPYPGSFTTYLWQDGSTAPVYNVTGSGLYWLQVKTPNGCTLRDSVLVEVDSIPQLNFFARDSFLCEGQSVLLVPQYTQVGFVDLSWDLGDGYTLGNDNPAIHSYDTAGVYNVTLTANYRKCPTATFTSPIVVKPFPTIDLGPDTSLCPGGTPIRLEAAGTAGNPLVKYTWSTGDTAFNITARDAGAFWAIADLEGCRSTDTVNVYKDCYIDIPNAFTPDGDGLNDEFFPRQLLSRSVKRFSMQVYDRWGQQVFATTNVAGRGWDGRFNDKEQPAGVFIYVIDVSFANGRSEHYQGNVTLMR